jgi:hypothetical protein
MTANRLTPNLPVSTPPKMERKTPGSAASHTRLLAEACVNPNSPVKVGSNGGIDCVEKRKATDEKTATKRFTCFPEIRLQQP